MGIVDFLLGALGKRKRKPKKIAATAITRGRAAFRVSPGRGPVTSNIVILGSSFLGAKSVYRRLASCKLVGAGAVIHRAGSISSRPWDNEFSDEFGPDR